jgi:hypothetical protein
VYEPISPCRRVATRYDKLAANYLPFIQFESIRLRLRVNESTPSLIAHCQIIPPCVLPPSS